MSLQDNEQGRAVMLAAMNRHLETRSLLLRDNLNALSDWCKSPIELSMGCALLSTDIAALLWIAVCSETPKRDADGLYICPQMPVGPYTADFGVYLKANRFERRMVVECDGHDFHERTKEQAAHDKARDRYFLDADWPVMRFTGSEIHKDAKQCALQVVEYLSRGVVELRRAAAAA